MAAEATAAESACPASCAPATAAAVAASENEETGHVLTACFFLLLWALLAYNVASLLLMERRRYEERRITEQGDFSSYLKYRFAHWYAWTSGSSVLVLLTLSATLLVFGGLLHSIFASTSLSDSLWASWIWISAPDGGNSAQPGGYLVGMMVSMGGMLIFALLVSIITSAFEEQLWHLRHGSIPVVEGNHIVMLGFVPMALMVLEELCLAMESSGGGLIVILAEQQKPDVEREIQDAELNLRGSSVVVRSGCAHSKEDLRRVAVQSARRILVLATGQADASREQADAHTLNVLLTLRELQPSPESCVVVECCLPRNQRLFYSLASGKMEVLTIRDFLGQLIVDSSRRRGLASVINETLGFDGDEFYITRIEGLAGWTFGDLLYAFPDVVPVGLMSPNADDVRMLPPMDTVLTDSDCLVVLAEDISELPGAAPRDGEKAARQTRLESSAALKAKRQVLSQDSEQSEVVILLGWNEEAESIVTELDRTLVQGSKVIVYSPRSIAERKEILESAQKRRSIRFRNLTVEHREGHLGARYKLEDLPFESAKRIFVLAEASTRDADRQTVASILQIRDILLERDVSEGDLADAVIVPQVLSKAAEQACYACGLQDCMDSNRLSARVMASVCQSPDLCAVFGELLSDTGARFDVRQLSEYIEGDYPEEFEISFYEVTALAAAAGEIAIGWSSGGSLSSGGCQWLLNPKGKMQRQRWDSEPAIVVIRRESNKGNDAPKEEAAEDDKYMPTLRMSRSQTRRMSTRDNFSSGEGSPSLQFPVSRRNTCGVTSMQRAVKMIKLLDRAKTSPVLRSAGHATTLLPEAKPAKAPPVEMPPADDGAGVEKSSSDSDAEGEGDIRASFGAESMASEASAAGLTTSSASVVTAGAVTASGAAIVDGLARLAELHQRGLLSAEEFAKAKACVLKDASSLASGAVKTDR